MKTSRWKNQPLFLSLALLGFLAFVSATVVTAQDDNAPEPGAADAAVEETTEKPSEDGNPPAIETEKTPTEESEASPEEPAKETPAETADPEPTPKDPAEATEPSSEESGEATPAGTAKEQYDDVLAEWKEIIKQLRDTRLKYHEGDSPDKSELQKQWDALIAKGQDLLPKVKEKALAAFKENPGEDRELSVFLAKTAEDDLASDKYQAAKSISEALLAAGVSGQNLHDILGRASFVLNEYAEAESQFEKAEEADQLSTEAQQFSGLVEEWQKYWEAEQKIRAEEAKADDLPRVKLSTTAGDMVIELFENQAPQTVGNFVSLVADGFYDGLTFHRVLPGFMAQGGDPRGTGTGDPGYSIYCETDREDYRRHFRGTLSMAHAGKNTGGSQFFITFRQTPQLDGRHTAFGRVIEGMDTLAKIQRINPQEPMPGIEPTKINKAEVLRKRDHEYKPTKVE